MIYVRQEIYDQLLKELPHGIPEGKVIDGVKVNDYPPKTMKDANGLEVPLLGIEVDESQFGKFFTSMDITTQNPLAFDADSFGWIRRLGVVNESS